MFVCGEGGVGGVVWCGVVEEALMGGLWDGGHVIGDRG